MIALAVGLLVLALILPAAVVVRYLRRRADGAALPLADPWEFPPLRSVRVLRGDAARAPATTPAGDHKARGSVAPPPDRARTSPPTAATP